MVADPLGIKVIRAYGLNKAWLIGFLMDIFGALLMLRALSLAPVVGVNGVPHFGDGLESTNGGRDLQGLQCSENRCRPRFN